MPSGVRLERAGRTGWIVIDNTERHNALTGEMIEQLIEALGVAAGDESIRVVVLRGAGEKAFVSGADIASFGSDGPPRRTNLTADAISAAIESSNKPVIAALRGWCLGAGTLVALAADIRIAGDDLKMGIPAAKLGLAYPKDAVARLVSLAGPAVAAELLMSGDRFDAEAASVAGLVNQVVPAADLFDAAAALAERIAANAPLTLSAAKRTIAAVLEQTDAEKGADADASIAACYRSEDFAEGRRAFAEKRPPVFEGR